MSSPVSESCSVSVVWPEDGTASGPVIVAVGEALVTVRVAVYSWRPPSRSRIAPLIVLVAGPSGAGTVMLSSPGVNVPSPSASHSNVKPAALSAADTSSAPVKATVAGVPSGVVTSASVAVGATLSTSTSAV